MLPQAFEIGTRLINPQTLQGLQAAGVLAGELTRELTRINPEQIFQVANNVINQGNMQAINFAISEVGELAKGLPITFEQVHRKMFNGWLGFANGFASGLILGDRIVDQRRGFLNTLKSGLIYLGTAIFVCSPYIATLFLNNEHPPIKIFEDNFFKIPQLNTSPDQYAGFIFGHIFGGVLGGGIRLGVYKAFHR